MKLHRRIEMRNYAIIGDLFRDSLDVKASQYTSCVGSITNRDFVRECVASVDAIIHTATLHKPHVGTHSRQECVDTNISGTLNLLEEAVSNKTTSFVFTSTTST